MATLARMQAPQALSKVGARTLLRGVARKFNFQPEIADWLVEQGVRSLADFQDLASTKESISTEVTDKMPVNTNWTGSKMVQTARVRMAWASTFAAAESDKQAGLVRTSQEFLLAPKSGNLGTASARSYDKKDMEPQRGRTRRRSPSDRPRHRRAGQATVSGRTSGAGSSGGDRHKRRQHIDRRFNLADKKRNGAKILQGVERRQVHT